jgi:hypothetical protein
MTDIERILTKLDSFSLNTYTTLISTYSVQSIAVTTGTTFRLTLTANISGIVAGMYVRVSAGANSGYHKIINVSTNYVDYTDSNGMTQGAIGSALFYSVKEVELNEIIDNQKLYINNVLGYNPFDGVNTITEIHSGTGHSTLILNRRPVETVTEIKVLSNNYYYYSISLSSIEIESKTGILKFTSNVSEGEYITSSFPRGNKNLKITYTVGAATPPDDIVNALILMSCSDILGNEAGYDGGGVSLSVVSYSKSYGTAGKYSEIRNQYMRTAGTLLKKYMTGIVD